MTFIKDLVASQSGFGLADILEADFETLMAIVSAKGQVEPEEEVLSMEAFMRTVG